MACIKKLNSDILFDCANFAVIGGVGNVDELVLINSDDISTVSIVNGLATVTMKTGTKGFTANSIRNSISYTDAIKTSDVAPNMEEHSIIIKLMTTNTVDAAEFSVLRQQLLGGNFRVAFKSTTTGLYYLAGALAGLEANDLATDSATDGVTTITLKTPDASLGDTLAGLTKVAYDKLKVAAT